jgi:hypothetical protein
MLARSALLRIVGALLALCTSPAFAHGVEGGDAAYLERIESVQFIPLMYLGAKHMVTGYDHVLFLAGIVFFLYRLKDVALYVTLFAVGHSATLLLGVLAGVHANPYIVDAIIGLSVVYKGFENIGGFARLGFSIDTRMAVLLFGFAHGFGLATKLQDLALSQHGLVPNMIAFNLGVELGQFAALGLILIALNIWRRTRGLASAAYVTNVLIMTAGITLFGFQLGGYLFALSGERLQ